MAIRIQRLFRTDYIYIRPFLAYFPEVGLCDLRPS
jgi:hypothetical protein